MSRIGDTTAALIFTNPVAVPDGPITPSVLANRAVPQFCRAAWGALQPLGPVLDALVISEEGSRGEHASFTGAFLGRVAHDLGQGWRADFTRFADVPDRARQAGLHDRPPPA